MAEWLTNNVHLSVTWHHKQSARSIPYPRDLFETKFSTLILENNGKICQGWQQTALVLHVTNQYLWSEVKLLSHLQLFATPWTVAYQAPPTIGFSRQEYWSGLPFPSPGDLPNPGIKPRFPTLESDALTSEPPGKPQLGMLFTIS